MSIAARSRELRQANEIFRPPRRAVGHGGPRAVGASPHPPPMIRYTVHRRPKLLTALHSRPTADLCASGTSDTGGPQTNGMAHFSRLTKGGVGRGRVISIAGRRKGAGGAWYEPVSRAHSIGPSR